MKDVLLVVAVLLAVGLSVVVIRYNEKAEKAGKSLEEERYGRMIAEESLQKTSAKAATLEAQLKAIESRLSKAQDILDQEHNVNADLKKQYDQLSQTKAELEQKLKTTLSQPAEPAAASNANAAVPVPSAAVTSAPAEQKAQ